MALSDYIYSAGTISVTAGQKAFTGTGTAWLLRDAVGAIVIVGGVLNVVGAITAENTGQFMDNWAGPTLSAAPYKMWLVTAEAATNLANHYRLAQIIASIETAQQSSEILSALAGLTPAADQLAFFTAADEMDLVTFKAWARAFLGLTMAADKLPYGTGPNTMGLTDITAQGRTALANITAAGNALIDDVNASAQLDTLGFSAFAKTLIYDANAGAAQSTLGISAFVKTLLDDASVTAFFATLGCAGAGSSLGNWFRLPNGLLLQFGITIASTNGGGGFNFTFPTAFSTTGYSLIAMNGNSASGAMFMNQYVAGGASATLGQLLIYTQTGAVLANTNVQVNWLAVGI